jgi:uncharacterized protein (TIGR03083 family)
MTAATTTTTRITRDEAKRIALEEFRRYASLNAALTDDEWALPTDCTLWDVHQMSLHVLGAADAQASFREFLHQFTKGYRLARKLPESHHFVDGINELQIREREHLSNEELVAQLTTVGPKAVRGRWRTPAPMRHLPIKFPEPVGWVRLEYLLDVGFTRDVFAHRIDIAQATGRDLELTADHDGRLVADMVAEWGELHDLAYELVLTGPAGGTFSRGTGGSRGSGGTREELDAIDFVRVISGRLPDHGVVRSNSLPL